jgi:hypothetical protein
MTIGAGVAITDGSTLESVGNALVRLTAGASIGLSDPLLVSAIPTPIVIPAATITSSVPALVRPIASLRRLTHDSAYQRPTRRILEGSLLWLAISPAVFPIESLPGLGVSIRLGRPKSS